MTEIAAIAHASLWEKCLHHLQNDPDIPEQKFNNWLRPLHAQLQHNCLILLAPNRFVLEWVKEHYFSKIQAALNEITHNNSPHIEMQIGTKDAQPTQPAEAQEADSTIHYTQTNQPAAITQPAFRQNTTPHAEQSKITFGKPGAPLHSNLNKTFTFDDFVEGKANQLARAAAMQVAANPGQAYNPLLIYGGVGLGKTHLMNAMGNYILQQNPNAKVLYLHSERFVADMIKALQRNAMNEFKRYYRNVNALLIDDIQFFAGKERSQEEFFHTFNSLLDGQQQIVLTCDRYPKEINGLEERLQSRFGWGLTIAVEPPELEMRVAILMSKAERSRIKLPHDVAFFIAKNIQSNVRELEGALKRVIANAQFTGSPITIEFTREALKDLLTLQAKLVTIDNIQRTTAEYYKIKVADLLSKRRSRSIARPRQVAMALAKELTSHSLPEIGDAFGGRDHTTVLHACRKVKELVDASIDFQEDWKNLLRILSA